MAFKDNTLEFSDTQIFDVQSGIEVMMFWEVPIMRKAAEYISHNNGDVLEIGFGMGICADYIQEQGVNSHTIIEGDWANLSLTDTYDGIFLDTFGDDNLDNFKTFALERIKSGGKITYWNNESAENNKYAFDSISYEQINVTPDENLYFDSNVYYMPKVTV